ncbi:hypothetical protein TNCV_3806491 [Trichonephila clavipes]|nr:hypothetical protein TNCV_3806491 [Trichonephila clavipes]
MVAKFKPKFEDPYRVLSVRNNSVVIWKAGRRITVNIDQMRIHHQRKSDEGVISVVKVQLAADRNINRVVWRRIDLGENKCKRSSGSKDSLIGLRQQQYKKTRQEVRGYKRRIPESRSAGLERKKSRRLGRETNKRALTPSSTSTKPVKKRKKSRISQAGSSKEDQAHTTFGAEETLPRKPVPNLQEEQCKPRGYQSGPEENHLVGQALTSPISFDIPDNKVANSLSRVSGAEDPVLISPDRVYISDNKVARSLKIVQGAEGQHVRIPLDSTLDTKIDLRQRTTRRHFYNNKLYLFT